MSVGTLAEAEMDPDKYDKADANVSEADRRKIKNIDQPKGINRKWLVPNFFTCVQQSWTTLAGVSPVMVIANEPCSYTRCVVVIQGASNHADRNIK